MDDHGPDWDDDQEADRRRWADFIERQRTGWGTPMRWVESWLGPVRSPVVAVVIAVVFFLLLLISYLAGGRAPGVS